MEWWVMLIIWAVIFVATLAFEFITADIDTIWFCLSSLICTVLAAFKVDYIIQIIVFVVISVLLIILTKPITKKMMMREIVKTNSDKIIGNTGVVVERFGDDEVGQIKIDGQIWRAINRDGLTFEKNEKVIIEGITGNRVIVKKLNSTIKNI